MKLSHIAQIINATLQGADHEFSGASIDSRTLKKGNVFIAIKGENFDGHDFIEAAAKAGAAGAIVSRSGSYSLPTLQVADTHQALINWATHHRAQFNIPVI
ncbi:MAG TPA: Mur ligase domain-containing protein, partial [Coxiellaceae bacterium]|nr:Mur ligase domain-containing protein [Coxiellaceae bacterium]